MSELIKGMILFSGGYDSTALLHKLIVSKEFDELIVMFERSDNLAGGYEQKNAKRIFNLFQKRYSEKYNIELTWEEETINLDIFSSKAAKEQGRIICLMTHLTTIMRHGEVNNFYLGWNKSNIKDLKITNKLYKWLSKNLYEDINIYFLEDYFDGFKEDETKYNVIKYLLDNKIFKYPFTSSESPSIKEVDERKYWYNKTDKEKEIAKAIIEFEMFNSADISKIFSFKTTKEVQDYYNKRLKEIRNKKKKNKEE